MIEDVLFRQLKKKAARESRSLQSVANEALRRGLAPVAAGYRLQLQGWSSELAPGLGWDDLADRDVLFDIFDGRR